MSEVIIQSLEEMQRAAWNNNEVHAFNTIGGSIQLIKKLGVDRAYRSILAISIGSPVPEIRATMTKILLLIAA